jgi:Spy/CpxP family protein refolding chaperone
MKGISLALTDGQRNMLQAEMQAYGDRLRNDLWPILMPARAALASQLAVKPIDENQVREALDAVLKAEREIKQTHMSMLIRLKNMLTPRQIARLQRFREAARPKR